jgi:hypothetical protein
LRIKIYNRLLAEVREEGRTPPRSPHREKGRVIRIDVKH